MATMAFVDFEDAPKWSDHMQVFQSALGDDLQWEYYRASCGEVPSNEDLDRLQGVIIPGARHSANDDWEAGYELVRRIVERGQPQLYCGCFGCQLLAVSLGGTVGPNPTPNFCFQSEAVACTEEWEKLPCVNTSGVVSGKRTYMLLESHGECVAQLPDGALLLGSSSTIPNEIWMVGNNVLAMQSHPEFTAALMTERILPALVEKGRLTEDAAAVAVVSLQNTQAEGDSDQIRKIIRAFLLQKRDCGHLEGRGGGVKM